MRRRVLAIFAAYIRLDYGREASEEICEKDGKESGQKIDVFWKCGLKEISRY